MEPFLCVSHDSLAIVLVAALLSDDCMCFNLQELQLQLEKAIFEIIILKGSACSHCKVLGSVPLQQDSKYCRSAFACDVYMYSTICMNDLTSTSISREKSRS